MKTVQIYILEAKGQKDRISTPSLYTYTVYGTMKEAQDHLDYIYSNLLKNPNLSPIREENRIATRAAFPCQYWVIKPITLPIAD